ncbi:uncharacterized protein LOC124896892 [Capsicum annuum]|uniref:uncharacterized protein LOC124896892 n=1 Tax=Capsicum annuum TaxID=4072 RepID=UPI001FB0EC5E|nr:uncharacterized protein LOC124896892 [Capsicum annuum]
MGSEQTREHSVDADESVPENDQALLDLLLEFHKLFEEPSGLPPARGVFDHRIVLQAGTEPTNKRPYRYPFIKKDIIKEYKRRVDNKVAYALSRVTGAELLALFISHTNTDLFQAIVASWDVDVDLQKLITDLQQNPTTHKCLETYLRCYCNKDASNWFSCLPMAEYWYNTSHHSAIQITSYEALYDRPPPLHLPYLPGESASAEIDNNLLNRELKLQLLKHHLTRAQIRMKQLADAHRTDRNFEVGDWGYFKIHPYKQVTITNHASHKLVTKFYGPFQIIKRVDPVAYTLLLPESVKIHSTIHVSLLKKCYELPPQISYPPTVDLANPHYPEPELVLQRRMVKKRNKAVAQVLIKWTGLPADVARIC